MSIDSDERTAAPASAAAPVAPPTGPKKRAASDREAKRAELQLLRERIEAARADGDALLAVPQRNTDPLSCFCCCNFKRLGQSYILRERRVVSSDGEGEETQLLIVGPHWIGVLVTVAIILGSTGVFLAQQGPLMPWYDTVVSIVLCAITLYYLFQTACTDPGIILPAHLQAVKSASANADDVKIVGLEAGNHPEVAESDDVRAEDTVQLLAASGSAAAASIGAGPRRRQAQHTRYCDICGIEQDRSTDHCEDCGVCVAGYDHHCPWMGKCIGRGNMRAFKMFNAAWVVYVCFVLTMAIVNVDWGHAAVQTLQRTASGEWVPVHSHQSHH